MYILSKTEKLLIWGLLGTFILLVAPYFSPALLEVPLSDFSPSGIVAKTAAILIFIGFLGFLSETPDSYKKTIPNILRVIFILMFALKATCNEFEWSCM